MLISRRLLLGTGMLVEFQGATRTTAAVGTAESLDRGIIGYWDANTISGTTLPDLSGHGNVGKINGPIKTSPGRFGSAMRLGSTWVDLALGDGVLSSSTGPITVFFWVNPDQIAWPGNPDPPVGVIFSKGQVAPGLVCWQWTIKCGARRIDMEGGPWTDVDADGLAVGKWASGTFTYDGRGTARGVTPAVNNTFAVYCNGVEGNVYTPGLPMRAIANDRSAIGAAPGGRWAGFGGAWELTVVYNRVLARAEIAQLAAGYRPKIG